MVCMNLRARTDITPTQQRNKKQHGQLGVMDQLEQHSEKSPQKIQNSGQQDGGSQGKALATKSKDLGPT